MKEQIDEITVHTETLIKCFFGDYRWLSNYHMCEVQYEGRTYTSSEAAYHSGKHEDEFLKKQLQSLNATESKIH